MKEEKVVPSGMKVQVSLCTEVQSYGVLSHRDLINAWKSMLKATGATHVEVDPDELLFGLIEVTQTHYAQKDFRNPLSQALEDFERTRWAWKRLKDKLEIKRKGRKDMLD